MKRDKIFTLTPFGLTAQEQNAWFEFGGGQEIADKIYAELGCKFFLCGNSGSQIGGWFKNEINSIDDLKGIKMRIGGYGGAVMKSLGSDNILHGQASKDNLTQEVLNSIWRFQKEASGWSRASLQSFLNARNKV